MYSEKLVASVMRFTAWRSNLGPEIEAHIAQRAFSRSPCDCAICHYRRKHVRSSIDRIMAGQYPL